MVIIFRPPGQKGFKMEYIVKTKDGDSTHKSYRDAIAREDMIHGILITPGGATNEEAFKYASRHQGFEGDFSEWRTLDDEERDSFEIGASGVPTV